MESGDTGVVIEDQKEELVVLSDSQKEIIRELEELEKRCAAKYRFSEIYLGAITVLRDVNNPGRFSQCAHSLRELIEKLPTAVDVPIKTGQESLSTLIGSTIEDFHTAQQKSKCRTTSNQWDGQIDDELRNFLEQFESFCDHFEDSNSTRKNESDLLFTSLDRSGRTLPSTLERKNYKVWKELRQYFVEVSHHKDYDKLEFCQQMEELEQFISDRLVPKPINEFGEIDSLVESSSDLPSSDVVKRIMNLIRKRPVNHDYFVWNLSSAAWIKPLNDEGLFSSPYAAIYENDSITFPVWPESQFLRRIANHDPEQVAEIMMSIQTNNMRVHEDLAYAAAKLPLHLALPWARKELKWLKTQEQLYLFLPEALAELCAYLAKSSETDISVKLARELLRADQSNNFSRVVPKHFSSEDYSGYTDYTRILEKQYPEVLKHTELVGVEHLCYILQELVPQDQDGYDKIYSGFWRPAIEPHDQNTRYSGDLRDALVDAIRDGSEQLISRGISLDCIVRVLLNMKRPIFTRIALHLCRTQNDKKFDLASSLVLDKQTFFDKRLWHEYSHLLWIMFPRLTEHEQSLILSWIKYGPSIQSSEDPTSDDLCAYKQIWQSERLSGLRGRLPTRWEQMYSEIVSEFGEPEHPDFECGTYISSSYGTQSPKSVEELESMSSKEIAEFLKSWAPSSKKFHSPTPEGLGDNLQTVVTKSPDRFVAHLDESFRDVEPTYARALVRGFLKAIPTNIDFDWSSILSYLEHVVEQPRNNTISSDNCFDKDFHWGWARGATIDLISDGIKFDIIPYSHRYTVWEILDKLADDPNPTSNEDEKSERHDFYSLSINTVRGKALHAVIQYACWVRHDLQTSNDSKPPSFDADSIPEVRERLEHHLDPAVETSRAIRAVFGSRILQLWQLDPGWTEANLSRIFPEEYPELRDAAWQTFVVAAEFHNVLFPLLHCQYRYAVDRLPLPSDAEQSSNTISNYAIHLGEHLSQMIGAGVIAWSDEDALVRNFLARTKTEDGSKMIRWIGAQLMNRTNPMEDEYVQRFMQFYEHLKDWTKKETPSPNDLMRPFGIWFASGRFNNDWAFDQLEDVIKTDKKVDPEHLVVKRLADLAGEYPMRCFLVLQSLVLADTHNYSFFRCKESVRTILRHAMDNTTAGPDARKFVQKLVSLGHFSFRDFFEEIPDASK